MGSVDSCSKLLFILNIVHVLLALGLAATGIWLFVEIQYIVNMRNPNHYLLYFEVHWPQAIPWFFVLAGLLVLAVSCCGFAGARKKSQGMVKTYIVFEVISVLCLIAAATLSFIFADSYDTEHFIKDTIYDGSTYMQTNPDIEQAFGLMERRFQCCGALSPREYIKWKDGFPISCCDTYYHGFIGSYPIDCSFSEQAPNERHGCSEVALKYVRIAIKSIAAVAILTAFIGLIKLIAASSLSRGLRKNGRPVVKLAGPHEFESKKVLL